jgi:hypothetical protein
MGSYIIRNAIQQSPSYKATPTKGHPSYKASLTKYHPYYQVKIKMKWDCKILVNCPSQERPPLLSGHFVIAEEMTF